MRKTKATRDPLAQIPAASIAKVKVDAEQDAADLIELLNRAETSFRAEFPDRLPPKYPDEALVGLKVAVRLRRWERDLVPVHLAIGLPSATEVMKFVTEVMHGKKLMEYVENLSHTVTRIVWDYFLWLPQDNEPRAELVIAAKLDDEFLLDAVADLVWSLATHRNVDS